MTSVLEDPSHSFPKLRLEVEEDKERKQESTKIRPEVFLKPKESRGWAITSQLESPDSEACEPSQALLWVFGHQNLLYPAAPCI